MIYKVASKNQAMRERHEALDADGVVLRANTEKIDVGHPQPLGQLLGRALLSKAVVVVLATARTPGERRRAGHISGHP